MAPTGIDVPGGAAKQLRDSLLRVLDGHPNVRLSLLLACQVLLLYPDGTSSDCCGGGALQGMTDAELSSALPDVSLAQRAATLNSLLQSVRNSPQNRYGF